MKTKLNKRLLRKVRNRIAAIPESYDQGHFYRDGGDAPCGTTECLAGEAVIVSRPTVKQGVAALRRMESRYNNTNVYAHPAFNAGRRLLGLTEEDANKMFRGDAHTWPEPFARQFEKAKTQRQRTKIAVAYLDECLKRGKVIW